MIILPSRVKNEDEKKKTGLILPSRVKDAKTVEQTESVLPKKTVVLPPKKQVSEVEAYNKEQSGFWKTIARVLLPKKLESKYGVEKIEPVKTTLSGGWENLTPEQQDTAKEIFKKETPTALKAKVPMFFQSLKETSTKDIPYYGSGKEAVELVGIARAYNRVKDGKGTEQDKILLNDYYEEQERQTELQKNVGYRAGETIKGSVRFMGELLPVAIVEALTGTLAPAGEVYAASKLAQKGTKQVIEGMIKDKVTRDLVKDVAKKKLATLTKQFIITAPTNITAGTAERMIGVVDTETGEIYQEGQPISDAIVNATTGHAVELITELGGGVSGKVLGGLTAPVKKIATKTAIFNALRKKLIGASDAKIEALLRKTGWNGVIGEFFEERDADILNQALYSLGLGDQKFEGLTKDDIATELIAFSVMGGGVAGIKSVKRLKEGLQKRQDIKKMQETKVKMPPKKAPVSSEIAPTSVQTQETVKDTTQPTEAPKTVKMPPKKIEDPLIQEAEILRGTKGMTADDIMATYPNIKLKRDIPATTINGVKTTIKEGEKLTPYELKGNKILLQDGKTYIVSKNQFQNIKGQSVVAEGKPFAPELEGLEESIKSAETKKKIPEGYGEKPLEQYKAELKRQMPKYENYTLPGGENYREILIKAPVKPPKTTEYTIKKTSGERPYKIYIYIDKNTEHYKSFATEGQAQAEIAKMQGENYITSAPNSFKSSHWDEPNVISHIRLNDRTYKGKKVAFMEELQSDWAREGRDKGFEQKITDPESLLPDGWKVTTKGETFWVVDEKGNKVANKLATGGDDIAYGGTKEVAIGKAIGEEKLMGDYKPGVPYNPLLKNWQELSIKRALKDAVDNNSDYFAWINGEQTSARYNLATYVQDVKWQKRPNDRGKHIDITPKSGNDIKISIAEDGKIQSAYGKSDWEGKKLDEVLGKGLADKIMAKESGTLSGEGLKFGGEWATNLYDKQVKNIVEKLTGQKVEMLDMGLPVEKSDKTWSILDSKGIVGRGLTPQDLKVGTNITTHPFGIATPTDSYVITDILDNGKFKAVPKYKLNNLLNEAGFGARKTPDTFQAIRLLSVDSPKELDAIKQKFDISQKTTQQQAIKLTPEVKNKIKGIAPKIKTSGKMFEEKPLEQKVVEKVEPIKYKSTIGKSGLAQSVRRKAIREKLIYGFDKRFRDLPEYDKRVKTEDRDKAIDFVLNDTDNAYEVAMGRQKPKGDMLPEDVYVVMVDYLTEIEDVEKVLDLTMNSELVGEATLMGQRIQALSQLDPLNPAKVLNDIKKEKEKALAEDKKKRGKKSKADETKDMKDSIDKDTQKGVNQSRKKVKTWVELVESLKC